MNMHRIYDAYPKVVPRSAPLKSKIGFCIYKSQTQFLRKNVRPNFFLCCWKIFWQHFFVATTKNNKFSGKWNLEELLHFVVATKKVDRILLQHHIGARAKIFPRARTPTLPKLRLKIRKKWIFPWFSPIFNNLLTA